MKQANETFHMLECLWFDAAELPVQISAKVKSEFSSAFFNVWKAEENSPDAVLLQQPLQLPNLLLALVKLRCLRPKGRQ